MIASKAVTKGSLTISQDTCVDGATELFRSTSFHKLPVIDNGGRPVGCISALAILHATTPAYICEKLLTAMKGGPD